MLTGKYPHATGVNLFFIPFPDEGNITIAEHLRERGYRTGLIGKTHFNNWAWAPLYKNGLPDHGFDVMIENGEYREWLIENPQPELPAEIQTYNRDEISTEDVATWMNSKNLPHAVYDEYSSGTYFARQAANFINESGEEPFFCGWLSSNPTIPIIIRWNMRGNIILTICHYPQGVRKTTAGFLQNFKILRMMKNVE